MDTLRLLVVSAPADLERITAALTSAGHTVISVDNLADAAEVLLIQRFEAVLLGPALLSADVAAFSARIKESDRRSGSGNRTAVLSVIQESALSARAAAVGVDGFVSETADPDAVTLAIARLASAVGSESTSQPAEQELPVLDVEHLKEQVAYDDELLVELIDLFLSERARQSQEMEEAIQAGDFDQLSRIAHTIKGSLGSLYALAAKTDAQGLELSAKAHDEAKARSFLVSLERDLNVLEAHLIAVRNSANP